MVKELSAYIHLLLYSSNFCGTIFSQENLLSWKYNREYSNFINFLWKFRSPSAENLNVNILFWGFSRNFSTAKNSDYRVYSDNTLYMKPCESLWHCIVGWNSNTFGSKVYPPIMCITFPGYISNVSCFQGNISDVFLLFPLIRPRKVVHNIIILLYF